MILLKEKMFQTSRYTLKFKVTADGQEEAEKQFYVNTTAKPVQKDTQDNKDNKDTDEGKDTGKQWQWSRQWF